MTPRLGLALATVIALGAGPQIAVACSGDACNSVSAGSWSSGKVTVTDKDKSGKISVKVCFKESRICNIWGLNPGSNSVVLSPPSGGPLPKNTTVEIVEASYVTKPTAAETNSKADTVAVCMAATQARCTGVGVGPYNQFLTLSANETSLGSVELRARQAVCKADQPIKTTKTVVALPDYAYYQFECKKL
jgi:hypothetical protein